MARQKEVCQAQKEPTRLGRGAPNHYHRQALKIPADVAQLVERRLAKAKVASSSLVIRSNLRAA